MTEVALVDEMVEDVDAPKSVTFDATLVWEVVNNVVSRKMQILISSYKYWSSFYIFKDDNRGKIDFQIPASHLNQYTETFVPSS